MAGEWGYDVVVVIAGLSNTYSSYVATREEYQAQRYEGSSTIFGPHTLDAYIQVLPPCWKAWYSPLMPPCPLHHLSMSLNHLARCDHM